MEGKLKSQFRNAFGTLEKQSFLDYEPLPYRLARVNRNRKEKKYVLEPREVWGANRAHGFLGPVLYKEQIMLSGGEVIAKRTTLST